jgi:hypothetical protein
MPYLQRMKPTGIRRRPLSWSHKELARAQAYLFRDLIEAHTGIRLSGGDVTDTFALTFHAMDWAELMISLTPTEGGAYYAAGARDVVTQRAAVLQQLLPGVGQKAARVILDMPMSRYAQCRSVDGAHLATLLAGRPSWRLSEDDDDRPMIFDALTDRGYVPVCFNADPRTNAERVIGLDPLTGVETPLPMEQVRYIRRGSAGEGAACNDLGLEDIAFSDAVAERFYDQALSYPLARRWYSAGNPLRIVIEDDDREPSAWLLSSPGDRQGASFDEAIQDICAFYGREHLIMLPAGLSEVRDPAERWKPTFRHSQAILPSIEAADIAYQQALDSIGEAHSGAQAEATLRDATRAYNETLTLALKAFWRDTREINSWQALEQAYMTRDPDHVLCFSSVSPLQVFRELIRSKAE